MNSRHLMVCASIVFWLLSPAFLSARTLVVSDFDDGSDPLNIDSASSLTSTDVSVVTGTYVAHAATEPARGNNGFSLKINHVNTSDAFFLINFTAVNLRQYRSLSFWVRGDAGGEEFKISLRRVTSPQEPDFRPNIKELMVSGITTTWQKVNIPIKAIFKERLTEDYEALSDVNGIILSYSGTLPAGIVYIDDLFFHTKSGNVLVDNFDDGADPMAFGHSPFDSITGGASAGLLRSYDSANALGGSGNAYKIAWSTGNNSIPTAAITGIEIDTRAFAANKIGVDISGTDTLSFHVKGESSADGKIIGIGLADDTGAEKVHASSVTMSTSYQEITRAMSGFAVNLDSASTFEIWFINDLESRGPPINLTDPVTFYIDNVRFLDTSTPTVPTGLNKNAVATVVNGMIFTSTDTLIVTADADSTDPTLERVRFEHDNLTGGANWYFIGTDTDTTDTTYSTPWKGFSNLLPGTSYQVRAVSEDVAGNDGRGSAFTSIALPLVHTATGFTGTPLSNASISWSWEDNSTNEDGFRVFSSTNGNVSGDLAAGTTFWVETSLDSNTQFSRFVRPFIGAAEYNASATVAKFTLANKVLVLGVAAKTNSSITISWSSGTAGNAQFVVKRAPDVSGSVGTFVVITTVSGNTFSHQDTGLASNTTFFYKIVGFNGDLIATDESPELMAVTRNDPVIFHDPITSLGVLGADVKIEATVTSINQIQSVELFFRKKGDVSFSTAAFEPPVSGLSYTGSATLSAGFVGESVATSGFEYKIVADDGVQVSSSPASGVHSASVGRTTTLPAVGSGGGVVTVSDGDSGDGETRLVIPSGALNANVQLTVRQLDEQSAPSLGSRPFIAAYTFGPDGLRFNKPIAMTLLYFDKNQDGLVDGTGFDERSLKFFWHDGFSWRNLGGSVDPSANTVTGSVSHFSTFGLFPASDPAEDEIRPKERIITPNNDAVNDFAQFGITGSFEIKIFNVKGRAIRTMQNVNVWDGRKDDGDIAESGVYVYRVVSDRITVTGTIGVAR